MMAQPKRDFSRGFRTDGPTPVPDRPTYDPAILEFGDPPPKQGIGKPGEGRRQQFVNALKANPGQWAEYLPPPGKRGWRGTGMSEMRKDYPNLEMTTRGIGNGLVRIWARWVPERGA